LSVLAGIIAPNEGAIVSHTESISLLSLQAGFVPFLSGRKNIILSGMLMGFSKKDMDKRMEEIIEFSELRDFIDEPVVTYSSGMKTRLGFSTAIHIDPDVILIDEVLGVGDAAFRKKSGDALKGKLAGDTSAVIVSHSEETIKELCDRVVFIHNGVGTYYGDVSTGMAQYNLSLNKPKS
jgi:lipopolysaccharide transport system ATP-binding protein